MRLRTVAIASTLVAAAGSAAMYPFLADQVPIHWNVHGQADDFASKNVAALGGPLLVLGMWLLFELTARIDPRRPGLRHGGREMVYKALLPMFAALHLATLAASAGLVENVTNVVVGVVGVMLVLLGNVLGKLRPNWFAGIRTPWTLENDEVWRRTNRLGARLFVAAGIVTVAMAVFASGTVLGVTVLASALVAGLVPAVYSYLLHRQLVRSGNA